MKTILSLAAFLLVAVSASAVAAPVGEEAEERFRAEPGYAVGSESGDSGYLSLGVSSAIERLAISSLHATFGLLGAFFFGFAVVGRLRAHRPGRG